MGELAQLAGRPALVDARRWRPVEALIIPPDRLRALLIAEAELGERIMRALILRRVGLLETGAGGPGDRRPLPTTATCCGSRASCAATAIRISASIPSTRSGGAGADRALPSSTPTSCRSCSARAASCCAIPAEDELARCIGLVQPIDPTRVYDVAVVGAGPGGPRDRGLCRVGRPLGPGARLPRVRRPGRRLGADRELSRLSDRHLRHGADGARLQPGAEVRRRDARSPTRPSASRSRTATGQAPFVLKLANDERVRARSVVIASGARYRRLEVDEPRRLRSRERALLGLAARGEAVRRPGGRAGRRRQFGGPGRRSTWRARSPRSGCWCAGAGLEASMSRYLVDRIAGLPNVELVTQARGQRPGRQRRHARGGALAPPHGGRAGAAVDPASVPVHRRRAEHRLAVGLRHRARRQGLRPDRLGRRQRHRLLETSRRGVFAIGDVRSGSTKRVAAAVGEGAQVVAALHAFLATAP